MSTGLGDRLNSPDEVTALNAKKLLIQSFSRKLTKGSCLEISMILPKFEKFGLTVNR